MATSPEQAPASSDPVICTCVGLTEGRLRALIGENPEIGFDDILARTGAGTTCTACLLDLEYQFTAAPRVKRPAGAAAEAGPDRERETISPKQRLYRLLDHLSPPVPYQLSNPLPVLAGHGIEEFVCIANDSLLYRGEEAAPPMRVGLRVRDGAGRLRHEARHLVEAGDSLRVEVSRHIGAESADPSLPAIGSVEITRLARRPGTRGTTRPQILINGTGGSCAVHGQAARVTTEPYWFTCLYRPGEERCFLSIVNVTGRVLKGSIGYPFGLDGVAPRDHAVTLAPHASTLHEIRLDEDAAARIGDGPLSLNMMFDRLHKAHFLCATPTLDRFSIDHL